jgi:hypothetical protein
MALVLLTQLMTGLGLAGSAGLNAYIPLLAVELLGRFEVIHLKGPFVLLTHPVTIVVTAVLLLIELLVDKVPAVDHFNDVVQTVVRPAAGALVFAAGSGAIGDVPPVALLAAGLVTAFSVHATKAVARPVVHTATLGTGGPVVSLAEDLAAAVGSLLAVFAPLLALVFFAVLGWGAWKVLARLRRSLVAT